MKRFIRDQTSRRIAALAAIVEATGDPPDDASVHDARVATRRLQQCLRLFGTYLDEDKIAKLQRRLQKLIKLSGSVRNCDITMELLTTAGVKNQRLAKTIAEQREVLEKDLAEHFQRLRRANIGKRKIKVSPRSKRSKKGDWDLRQSPSENARRVLPALVATWFNEGQAALQGGEGGQKNDALHRFRLSGKRIRYTLELFADLYDGALETPLKDLRRVQDHLGAIQDCVAALPLLNDNSRASAAVKRLLTAREQDFRTLWMRDIANQDQLWIAALQSTASESTKEDTQ